MSSLFIPLAALLLGAAPADECAEPRTQSEMNRCAARDFRRADAELNRQWAATMKKMRTDESFSFTGDKRPSGDVKLREAQRAWLAFRDAQCTVEGYQARGGSMEPMLYDICREELTRARTEQLRKLITE